MKLLRTKNEFLLWKEANGVNEVAPKEFPCYASIPEFDSFWVAGGDEAIYLYHADIVRLLEDMDVQTIYDWTDRRIPPDCGWLATDEEGRTFSFKKEPTYCIIQLVPHKLLQWRGDYTSHNTFEEGVYLFDRPFLAGKKEKRPLLQERTEDKNTTSKATKEQEATPVTEAGLIAAGYTKNEHSAMASNFYKEKHFAEGRGIRRITFDFSKDGDFFCRAWDGGGYSARVAIESMEDLGHFEKMLLL